MVWGYGKFGEAEFGLGSARPLTPCPPVRRPEEQTTKVAKCDRTLSRLYVNTRFFRNVLFKKFHTYHL